MAATAIKPLVEASYLPNAATIQYTCPPRTRTFFTQFTLSNQDATVAYTASIHIVPSGGAATTENRVQPPATVSPEDCVAISGMINQTLNEGDTLQCFASTADKITLRVSGVELSINPAG